MIADHACRRHPHWPLGGRVVQIYFHRIEGKSSDLIMGHVRAGQEVLVREIKSAGFKLVGEEKLLKETTSSGREDERESPAKTQSLSENSGQWVVGHHCVDFQDVSSWARSSSTR